MTTLKRHALEWLGDEIGPDLSGLREWFGLSVPQSHAIVRDLLGTCRDDVVSLLIPLVLDLCAEEDILRKEEVASLEVIGRMSQEEPSHAQAGALG